MAHTLDIPGKAAIPLDVTIPVCNQDALELQSITRDEKGDSITATYVDPSIDPNYPVVYTVKSVKTKDQLRSSISIAAWATDTDEEGVLVERKPISAVLAVNFPPMNVDVTDVRDMLAGLYGLSFYGVDGGDVPTTGHISKLLYRLVDMIGA